MCVCVRVIKCGGKKVILLVLIGVDEVPRFVRKRHGTKVVFILLSNFFRYGALPVLKLGCAQILLTEVGFAP